MLGGAAERGCCYWRDSWGPDETMKYREAGCTCEVQVHLLHGNHLHHRPGVRTETSRSEVLNC